MDVSLSRLKPCTRANTGQVSAVCGPGSEINRWANQGSCKVVSQAADLAGCWRREAAIRCQPWAAASTARPPGGSDLGRGRVLTVQVKRTAVAQEARRRPMHAITAGQAAKADFATA